jgi:hypothetical protein
VAITKVETTMASWGCCTWPVSARKSVWVVATLPRYANANLAVRVCRRRGYGLRGGLYRRGGF